MSGSLAEMRAEQAAERRALILAEIQRQRGRVTDAARILGVSRGRLYRLAHDLGLDLGRIARRYRRSARTA